MRHIAQLFILYILFTTSLFSCNEENNTTLEDNLTKIEYSCYRFSKDDFIFSVGAPEDMIVSYDVDEVDPEPASLFLHFQFPDNKEIPLTCLQCADLCFSYPEIPAQIYTENNKMYLHLDYMQFVAKDSSLIKTVQSKSDAYAIGEKVPCDLHRKPLIKVPNLAKGSKKEKLLKSIKHENIILYDLAYYKDFAIAVGEEDKRHARNVKCQHGETLFQSIVLRTTNGGLSWEKLSDDAAFSYAPGDTLLVTNKKNIIIIPTNDLDAHKTLNFSTDGGDKWQYTEEMLGEHISFYQYGDLITVMDKDNLILVSPDKGSTWQSIFSYTEEGYKEESKKIDTLAILQLPNYKIDYEHNSLIVKHNLTKCLCNTFSLPLVYNQRSYRKGILGYFWSLGVEDSIQQIDEETLMLFDAKKGKKTLYKRDPHNNYIFLRAGHNKIVKNNSGYQIDCSNTTYYFNKAGKLVNIHYPDKSYSLHYNNDRLIEIKESHDNKISPYLTFSYQNSVVSITFHTLKKEIHFIKPNDILRHITDQDQRIFSYEYSEEEESSKNTTLDHVHYYPEDNASTPLYDFVSYTTEEKKNVLRITDYSQNNDHILKTATSYQYLTPKETKVIVNTLTEYSENNCITNQEIDMSLYTFRYYDTSKEHLAATQSDITQYGFDTQGNVNFYSEKDHNISVTYNAYNKLKDSIVYKGKKRSEYHYAYTQDKKHHLNSIITPTNKILLHYDDNGDITHVKSDKYEVSYLYNTQDKPKKIIFKDKGEMLMTYKKNGDINETKVNLFDKSLSETALSESITHAMTNLLENASAGSIKKFPKWLW